jgi:hypothetical protein
MRLILIGLLGVLAYKVFKVSRTIPSDFESMPERNPSSDKPSS